MRCARQHFASKEVRSNTFLIRRMRAATQINETNLPVCSTVFQVSPSSATCLTPKIGYPEWSVPRPGSCSAPLSLRLPTAPVVHHPGARAPLLRWQVHICIMRLLAEDEDRADRRERSLELALLDAVTWPEFVWDWLRLVGESSPHMLPVFNRESRPTSVQLELHVAW